MNRSRQRGTTLVVGLVMLVVLTLLVVSAIRSGNINMRIVGNMQMQNETAAAAVEATERMISTDFIAIKAASSVPVGADFNGDKAPDFTANVPAPTCTGSQAITNAELNPANINDRVCITSATVEDLGPFVEDKTVTPTVPATCYYQHWEVQATVTDARTGATATSHQGVSLRVSAETVCP